jgi:hypothetical protein
VHRRNKWAAVLMPRPAAFVGGLATNVGLDRVERGDPPQRLCREG